MTDKDDYAWRSGQNLMNCVKDMWTSLVLADVTFVVGEEGSRVSANKCILAARSPVFHAMFTGPWAKEDEIRVPDVDEEHFRTVLGFLYTDEIVINKENVAYVTYISRKYLLDTLFSKCVAYLEKIRSDSYEDTYLGLQLGYLYCSKELYNESIARIRRLADQTFNLEEFTLLYHGCVKDLLQEQTVTLSEDCVFDAVSNWAEEECRRQALDVNDFNKRHVLGDIFDLIQFQLMDSDFFHRKIANSVLLTKKESKKYANILRKSQVTRFRRYRKGTLSSGTVSMVDIQATDCVCLSGILCVRRYGEYQSVIQMKCTIDILCGEDIVSSTEVTKGVLPSDAVMTNDGRIAELILPKSIDIIANRTYSIRLTNHHYCRINEGVVEKKKIKYNDTIIKFTPRDGFDGNCIAGLLLSNAA